MYRIRIPPRVEEFSNILVAAGKQCFLVGGAVRDSLLGRSTSDFDIATDAQPSEIRELFRSVVPTGIKHGTVTVLFKGTTFETTTFRTEGGYSDGRRPDSVEFTGTIEEDLSRRDFTINALAYDIPGRHLVDLFDGRGDLGRRLIRAVGDPGERFSEDGLRLLRAVRFASQLGFRIESGTLESIPRNLGKLEHVSRERVRDEFVKIILSPKPSVGLRLMEETGMLALLVPELPSCRGIRQKGAHRYDVLDHLYATVDSARRELVSRLAALFHDVGKPKSMTRGSDGTPDFHGHDICSAEMCSEILRGLRLPNEVVRSVTHVVRHHMFNYTDDWTDAAVRRFLARVGIDSVEDLFDLRIADGVGTCDTAPNPAVLAGFRERITKLLEREQALGIKDLALGGEDLASMGIPRGPAMGRILAELLEAVLDDPELNTGDRLRGIVSGIREKYGV